jgi:acetyl-CoA carboxylase carboxyltransferase component
MGGLQAASVLSIVKKEQLARRGEEFDEAEQAELEKEIIDKYEREGSPYFSTARLWDDGVIDPLDTRKYLSRGLRASLYAPFGEHKNGVFRM